MALEVVRSIAKVQLAFLKFWHVCMNIVPCVEETCDEMIKLREFSHQTL